MTPSAAALTSVKEAIEVAKALGYDTQLATEVNDRGYVKKYGAEIVNPWTQEVVEV